jgi:hypothetical protein
MLALLGYDEKKSRRKKKHTGVEMPQLSGLGAAISVSNAMSMPGGQQWQELVGYASRLRGIANGMPSGPVAESFYEQLNTIDILLKQAKGSFGWLDWTRKPDWIGSPALWEREYKDTKWQLQAMEQEMSRRTGAMTTIPNVPKQPAVTVPMSVTGEGPAYVAPATPENIIGPTAWNRPPSQVQPQQTSVAVWVVGLLAVGAIAYIAWPKKGK